MIYTLCWHEPAYQTYLELEYGTLADAQLHMDYLVSLGLTPIIKCQELN